MKELNDIEKDGIPGVKVEPHSDNILFWDVIVDGPAGSVYEGGHFKVLLEFPYDYPLKAPLVRFRTKIYHPSFDDKHYVCFKYLWHWQPIYRVSRVFEHLLSFMMEPDPNEWAGKAGIQFRSDRAAFDETARVWTREYAM